MSQVARIEREIPPEIKTENDNLERNGFLALYRDDYAVANAHFLAQYEFLAQAQRKLARSIHKGGPLHNIGIALLGQALPADALYSFVLAYVEDTLSTDFDSEDDADRAQAGSTLRDSFLLKLRVLREIKARSRQIKLEGRWAEATDPRAVFAEDLPDMTRDTLRQLCERPDIQIGPTPLGFPQPRERRVFIGVNYDILAHVIPDIKLAVRLKGYTPIVVREVVFPPQQTHGVSILLLHTCAFAVFDITAPGGQLMEIERAKDYGTNVLLLRSQPAGHPAHISQMIKSLGYPLETYQDMAELRDHVMQFLP